MKFKKTVNDLFFLVVVIVAFTLAADYKKSISKKEGEGRTYALTICKRKALGDLFILFINYTGDDKLSTLHHKFIFMHFLDQDKGNIFNINKYWAGFYCQND